MYEYKQFRQMYIVQGGGNKGEGCGAAYPSPDVHTAQGVTSGVSCGDWGEINWGS